MFVLLIKCGLKIKKNIYDINFCTESFSNL